VKRFRKWPKIHPWWWSYLSKEVKRFRIWPKIHPWWWPTFRKKWRGLEYGRKFIPDDDRTFQKEVKRFRKWPKIHPWWWLYLSKEVKRFKNGRKFIPDDDCTFRKKWKDLKMAENSSLMMTYLSKEVKRFRKWPKIHPWWWPYLSKEVKRFRKWPKIHPWWLPYLSKEVKRFRKWPKIHPWWRSDLWVQRLKDNFEGYAAVLSLVWAPEATAGEDANFTITSKWKWLFVNWYKLKILIFKEIRSFNSHQDEKRVNIVAEYALRAGRRD
jgi:hypothetical protein